MSTANDIASQLRELRQHTWAAQSGTFDKRALAWLALLPAWWHSLAENAGFPVGTGGIDAFLEQAVARGLCTRSTDGSRFWMPDVQREEALEQLTQDGSVRLLDEAATLGRRVEKTIERIPEASAPVKRWAMLAARLDRKDALSRDAAAWLSERLRTLIDAGETGEALAWIETGKAFVSLFGGALETAVRLGERGLEVLYRRERDARYLRSFLPRTEQIDAFLRLFERDDGPWALHYLGVGGVGKTMLLRYLVSNLADQYGFLTSRIDFDYINPDFPARKPGQLFFELADELRLHAEPGIYDRFRSSGQHLHELLSREPLSDDPVSQLRHGPLEAATQTMVASFSAFLQTIRQRVVLILDTCEELAKYQPSGARLPSVEVTLYLLEQVHAVMPSIRVVFAGRRLLARAGDGWQADPEQEGSARSLLPDKKAYLALHTIRGFVHSEARQFLCGLKQAPIASPAVYRAALTHSREMGVDAPLRPDDASPARPSFEPLRYNPFDLDLFANWLIEEPDLTAERIASGRQDPYIDRRILDRLQPELRHLLPAVTLLGRFDEMMLQPVLGQDPEAAHRIFRALGEQEWINHQRDEALSAIFLSVHPGLLRRLRDYYSRDENRNQLLHAARATLGPGLDEKVRNTRLRAFSTDLLDAALRLNEEVAAAALWNTIERRIPEEADWAWALTTTTRLLGADGAVGSEAHPLRAGVEATLAAALLHQQPDHDLRPNWTAVQSALHRYPDPAQRRVLHQRAVAGILAATPSDKGSDAAREARAALVGSLRERLDESAAEDALTGQLAASYLAAFAALLDAAEVHGSDLLDAEVEAVLKRLARRCERADFPKELVAFAYLLAARAAARRPGDIPETTRGRMRPPPEKKMSEAIAGPMPAPEHSDEEAAMTLFDHAASLLPEDFLSDRNRWYDWVPPRSLRMRVLLERLRAYPPTPAEPGWEKMRDWQDRAALAVDDIDAERLLSWIVQLRLAYAPPHGPLSDAVSWAQSYDPRRRALCEAHRRVPPLVVTTADALLAQGRAAEALRLLGEHREAATRQGRDQDTVEATATATVHMLRRARLRRQRSLLLGEMQRPATGDPSAPVRRAALEAGLLCGIAGNGSAPPDGSVFGTQLREASPPADVPAPPRRAALRRLERAEVSAVFDPARALPELEQARDALLAADDAVGAFQAALLAALAHVRLDRDVPDDTLHKVQSAYEAAHRAYLEAAGTNAPVPTWPEMEAAAQQFLSGTPDLAFLDHPDWEQWLRRLFLLLLVVARRGTAGAEGALERIQEWLQTTYRGEIPPEMLPPGRRSWSRSNDAAQEGGRGVGEPSRAPEKKRFAWLRTLGTAASGLAMAGGLLYGGYHLFIWVLRWLLTRFEAAFFTTVRSWLGWPGPGRTFVLVLLYIVALVGLYKMPAVYRWLRRAWLAFWRELQSGIVADFRVTLRVRAEGLDRADRSAPAQFQLQVLPSAQSFLGLLPLRHALLSSLFAPRLDELLEITLGRKMLVVDEEGATPGLDAYRAAPGAVPERLRKALSNLHGALGRRTVPVQLDLQTAALHALPWEATLAFSTGDREEGETAPAVSDRLRAWRLGRHAGAEGVPVREAWRSGGVCYVGSGAWRLMAESTWKSLGAAFEVYGEAPSLTPRSPEAAAPTQVYRLVHVVGAMIQTRAGVRLQVSDLDRLARSARPSAKQVLADEESRSGTILAATDLPAAVLIVLQGNPSGILLRSRSEREQAAIARTFAAEVCEQGARAVLVLPGLPLSLSEQILQQVALGLSRSAPELSRLLDITQKVRTTIATWQPPDQNAAPNAMPADDIFSELALDVCLFYVP